MERLLFVAAGGALGALLRYGVAGLSHKFADPGFPWGTLVVNLSGCLAIGLLWGLSERFVVPVPVATFVFVGVLGAYTTFSTFSLETLNLLRDGETGRALVNIVAQNGIALGLAFGGIVLARILVSSVR